MRGILSKSFIIVIIIGILLGISFPKKQIITGKDGGIQETIQVHVYFWFLTTFRVIDKNISRQPISIESLPHDIVLKDDHDSIYIPGGAHDLPAIFTTLQPNKSRISRLYFKILLHSKYELSKQTDWGFDSSLVNTLMLRGVLKK